jgi:hypothetical protein
MYNKDLAEKILEQLGKAYPKKVHLHELQSALPGVSNVPNKEWLNAIEILSAEELVTCAPLSGQSGWEDAANIILTNAGRQTLLEDQRLDAIGDKRFKQKTEPLYEELIRKEVPALVEALRGTPRSSSFANQTAELVLGRFGSLKDVVVESYIRPLQQTKLGVTELRENRLRRKLDQLWEQELLRAKGVASSLCQSTGLSAADVQPWVSQVEVRGRRIKLAVFDEIEIAKLEGRPSAEMVSTTETRVPELYDFSFVQNADLRSAIRRDQTELATLDPKTATKSVLVLSGAIIEGLLLDALVGSGEWSFEEGSPKHLNEMIEVAAKRNIISEDRLSHAVRNYRNLVHLGREIREGLQFTHDDAVLARSAVGVIGNELRRCYAKRGAAKTTSP